MSASFQTALNSYKIALQQIDSSEALSPEKALDILLARDTLQQSLKTQEPVSAPLV